MQGTTGAEVRLRAGEVGRKRATKLFKARKVTKDGRNEHTSDYLSVVLTKNGKNRMSEASLDAEECGWSFDEFKVGRTQRSVKRRL